MNKDGKLFEEQWKRSIPEDVYYLRLKDNPSSFGKDSSFVRFTLNNPFDCLVFYNGFLFPLELKSTSSKSISIQTKKEEKGKMIKINQIEGLSKSNKYKNIFSGFLFDFRESEKTFWMGINDFLRFQEENNKKSINEKDIIKYNAIDVEKEKKKTRYVFSVKKLIEDVVMKNGEKNSL